MSSPAPPGDTVTVTNRVRGEDTRAQTGTVSKRGARIEMPSVRSGGMKVWTRCVLSVVQRLLVDSCVQMRRSRSESLESGRGTHERVCLLLL